MPRLGAALPFFSGGVVVKREATMSTALRYCPGSKRIPMMREGGDYVCRHAFVRRFFIAGPEACVSLR